MQKSPLSNGLAIKIADGRRLRRPPRWPNEMGKLHYSPAFVPVQIVQ